MHTPPTAQAISPTLVRRAFVDDVASVTPVVVVGLDYRTLNLVTVEGRALSVLAADRVAAAHLLKADDLTRVAVADGELPLGLYNANYRILALAFGASRPRQLRFSAAVDLDRGEIPPSGRQPGWRFVHTDPDVWGNGYEAAPTS